MVNYVKEGYESRTDYLLTLCDEFGADPAVVFALAGVLGENEDFNGLVNELEDMYYYE